VGFAGEADALLLRLELRLFSIQGFQGLFFGTTILSTKLMFKHLKQNAANMLRSILKFGRLFSRCNHLKRQLQPIRSSSQPRANFKMAGLKGYNVFTIFIFQEVEGHDQHVLNHSPLPFFQGNPFVRCVSSPSVRTQRVHNIGLNPFAGLFAKTLTMHL
jgi:hypothetical protein